MLVFIEFRGLGLLVVVPILVGMIAAGFSSDYRPKTAFLIGSLSMALTAAGLTLLGNRLNRKSQLHSFNDTSLETWGKVLFVLGLGIALYIVFAMK